MAIDTYERPLFAKGFLICGEVGFAVIYPAGIDTLTAAVARIRS